jgi:pyrimidine operon attenuation protein / uracil phosphoribosyltransferase
MVKQIFNAAQLQLTIQRMARQLHENHPDLSDTVLIGLQPRGVLFSDVLVKELNAVVPGKSVQYGKLDITFYRDDIRTELHKANKTDIPFSIEASKVILIDDVLYTGRTIRAAMDALLDFGRPAKVELCVLIDRRFRRELPIQPDYTGKAIDSIISEKVKVLWQPGGEGAVVLE